MKTEFDPVIVEQALRLEFSPEEIEEHERANVALSGTQPEQFLCEYETVHSVRAMGLKTEALTQTEREFRSVARWHTMRHRPQLAAKYARLADVVRSVLKKTFN